MRCKKHVNHNVRKDGKCKRKHLCGKDCVMDKVGNVLR